MVHCLKRPFIRSYFVCVNAFIGYELRVYRLRIFYYVFYPVTVYCVCAYMSMIYRLYMCRVRLETRVTVEYHYMIV